MPHRQRTFIENPVPALRDAVEILRVWPTETGFRMIVLKSATRFLLEQDADHVAIYRAQTAAAPDSGPMAHTATLADALDLVAAQC